MYLVNEDKVYISVSKECLDDIEQHIKDKYSEYVSDLCIKYVPQDDEDSCLLAHDTRIPLHNNIGFGLGSVLLRVKSLSLIRENAGCFADWTVKPSLEEVIEKAIEADDTHEWASVGCIAKHPQTDSVNNNNRGASNDPSDDHENGENNNWYCLSVAHLASRHSIHRNYQNDHTYIITAFQHSLQDPQEKKEAKIKARDFVFVSNEYDGKYGVVQIGRKAGNLKCVDIGMFGPLKKSMLRNYERFELEEKNRIIPEERYHELEGALVTKTGAATKYTEGIILVVDHSDIMDNSKLKGKGVLAITSFTDQHGQHIPDEEGSFAEDGDSGAIVFLKNESLYKGIGIIYKKVSMFKHGDRKLKNVILCAHLDTCLEGLRSDKQWSRKPELFVHCFKPILCIGKQDVTDRPEDESSIDEMTPKPSNTLKAAVSSSNITLLENTE